LILAFVREKEGDRIFVVANLSPDSKTFNLIGNDFSGDFIELFSTKELSLSAKDEMTLEPWGFRVFVK